MLVEQMRINGNGEDGGIVVFVVAVVVVAVERMQINANSCRWIKIRCCNQGV